jgi:hypothetical protein
VQPSRVRKAARPAVPAEGRQPPCEPGRTAPEKGARFVDTNRMALKLTDTDSAPPSAALDMSDTWRSNSLTKPRAILRPSRRG